MFFWIITNTENTLENLCLQYFYCILNILFLKRISIGLFFYERIAGRKVSFQKSGKESILISLICVRVSQLHKISQTFQIQYQQSILAHVRSHIDFKRTTQISKIKLNCPESAPHWSSAALHSSNCPFHVFGGHKGYFCTGLITHGARALAWVRGTTGWKRQPAECRMPETLKIFTY